MKIAHFIGATLTGLLLLSVPVSGQEVVVSATGYGSGSKLTAINEATEDALRKAVEQGCGVFIQSKSTVKDFVLIKDQIISESKGFITHHSVTAQKYNPNRGIAEVTVKATVSKKLLMSKWAAHEGSLNRIGMPKLMFVTRLIHGKVLTSSKEAENRMTQPFIEARFFIVSAEMVKTKKKIDLQLAAQEGNMSKLVQAGKDFGCDLVIDGKVTGELTGKYKGYEGEDPSWKYTFNFQFNSIRTSDSRILNSYSDNFEITMQSQSPSDAFRMGAAKFADWVGPHIRRKLMKYWAFAGQNHMTFHLEVKGVKFKHAKRIRQWLKKQSWVKNVWQDRFGGGIVILRFTSNKSLETVMDKISEANIKGVPIEIEDNDKTYIKASLATEDD